MSLIDFIQLVLSFEQLLEAQVLSERMHLPLSLWQHFVTILVRQARIDRIELRTMHVEPILIPLALQIVVQVRDVGESLLLTERIFDELIHRSFLSIRSFLLLLPHTDLIDHIPAQTVVTLSQVLLHDLRTGSHVSFLGLHEGPLAQTDLRRLLFHDGVGIDFMISLQPKSSQHLLPLIVGELETQWLVFVPRHHFDFCQHLHEAAFRQGKKEDLHKVILTERHACTDIFVE